MSPVQFKYGFYKTELRDPSESGTNHGINPIPQSPPPNPLQLEHSLQALSSINLQTKGATSHLTKPSLDDIQPMETETIVGKTLRKLQSTIGSVETSRAKISPQINSSSNIDDEINDIKKQVQLKHETLEKTRQSFAEVKNSRMLSLEDKATLLKQIEQLLDNEIRLKADIKSLEESLVKEKEMYVRISRQMKDMDNQNMRMKKLLNVETNRIRVDLEPELMCKICKEPFTEAVVINCGHCYCKACVEDWRKKNHVCPACDALIVSHVKVVALDKVVKRWLYATGE